MRVAVVGAGVIGAIHAGNAAAHPGCQLRWVIDRDARRAARLAWAHGVESGQVLADALAGGKVDAAIIASSTAAHAGHMHDCIEADIPFLCEKPLTDGFESARNCFLAAERAGIVAATGFNRRLDSDYRSLFERVRAGEIGRVESLHIVSRTFAPPDPRSAAESGGMIREKGAHFYDLASWIPGHSPVEVFATGTCLIDPGFAEFADVDTASLILRFDSGASATFSFGRRTAYGQDELIEVFGSEGMLVAGRRPAGEVTLYKGDSTVAGGIPAQWLPRFRESYALEMDAFYRAVTDGAPVHASLGDGFRAQAVAEAALRSIAENRPQPIHSLDGRDSPCSPTTC